MKKSKMYILVKESVPTGKAVVAVAHASLACYLKFQDMDEMKNWLSGPCYKKVCNIYEEEFERVKEIERHIVITEYSLNDEEIAIAFCPREIYPKGFQFYSLFK